MIQWVYERSSEVFSHLLVATDDHRIFKAVLAFGGKAVMTSKNHESGTERCAEAHLLYKQETGAEFSHVVNIQGDEPLIEPEQLQSLLDCFRIADTRIATLIRPMKDPEELHNPNVVKAVVDQTLRALYFSRAPIPHLRDHPQAQWHRQHTYFTHIGLYGFRSDVLEQIVRFPPTPLEQAESLEQLRWLENGIPIQTAITHHVSQGVDTPEDLEKLNSRI